MTFHVLDVIGRAGVVAGPFGTFAEAEAERLQLNIAGDCCVASRNTDGSWNLWPIEPDDATPAIEHTVTTELELVNTLDGVRGMHRAACTCGWQSSRAHSVQLALAQGEAHLNGTMRSDELTVVDHAGTRRLTLAGAEHLLAGTAEVTR